MKKNRLKTLRKERGDSQSEIASLLSVNVKTISRWEKGNNEIKVAQANMLANHFGVSVAYLLGESDFRTTKDEFENEIQKQDRFYPDYGDNSDTPIEPYVALAISTVGKEYKTLLQEKIIALAKGDAVQAGKYINALNKLPIDLQKTVVRYLLLPNSMQVTIDELLAALGQTSNGKE